MCGKFEEVSLENFIAIRENRKREEKLYQRVCALEDENNQLMKEIKRLTVNQEKTNQRVELYREHNTELTYNHNTMVPTINTIISELNNIILILSNKDEEN